jgi:2-C-methyl-D-erythritol 4-phosphate cytidylyltransferase/2-C-methyl-D-erythritol 2,4-cyclodiphosphate synthase
LIREGMKISTGNSVWALILAAGRGTRMGPKFGAKQFFTFQGKPLFWHSAETFSRSPRIQGLVFVFPPAEIDKWAYETRRLNAAENLGLDICFAPGGERRQDSVMNGLQALPRECDTVLVHDAARPFFSPLLVTRILEALDSGAQACVPGVVPVDTVKETQGKKVLKTLNRQHLVLVQTPQGFDRAALIAAHARSSDLSVTDDASLMETTGHEVVVVDGEVENVKLTRPEDMHMLFHADVSPNKERSPCTGMGYDVHRFGGDRPLVLGTIPIPGAPRVHAHSDGDVLLHAVVDAVLGCLGQGDIGRHFPDSDPAIAGAASAVFLARVMDMAGEADLVLTHADCTVITQVPKIAPHAAVIRSALASLLGLSASRVNVKATTEEGLGFTGARQGIKAVAVITGTLPAEPDAQTAQPSAGDDRQTCSSTTP